MDAVTGQSIPPPPPYPPPVLPPPPPPAQPGFGYVIPRQSPTSYGQTVAPGYRPAIYPYTVPPVRRGWVGKLSVSLAIVAAAAVVFTSLGDGQTVGSRPDPGLHSVNGISADDWSAEFVDSSGAPARWDPCTPIHYVVNLDNAPAGGLADVQEAFRRVSAASGLTFVDDGKTSEQPMQDREPYQPQAYGKTWAPILIGWSTPANTDLLGDSRAEAVTVPIALNSRAGTGGGSIVSAEVVLNTAHQLPVGFGPGPSEGEVLMHEFGHVVGLGHVSSIGDAMYPTVRGIAAYGTGDLAGFAAVGLPAGCHAAPVGRQLQVHQTPQG